MILVSQLLMYADN